MKYMHFILKYENFNGFFPAKFYICLSLLLKGIGSFIGLY